MKKKISACIGLILIFSQALKTQNWEWSKKITTPQNFNYYGNDNLLTDKNGIIYSGRSNNTNYWYDSSTDTTGSYLQAYSVNGQLLFEKQWKIPFLIKKLIYDGNQSFYFAGIFYGNHVIDGITINSEGISDGVLGKMDLTGNISWMQTFGGGGMDAAYDVCLGTSGNDIYVSGTLKDTLFFNNVFHSVNAQSGIICQYSSDGTLIRHKLYDFTSVNNYNTNACVELSINQSGDFFVLMDRKADRWWDNDPGTGPTIGRYLVKLNSNLDTIWTTYVNGPQSYYGWSCDNLRAADNGDAYLLNWNSGKYGGLGQIIRFDGFAGGKKWSYPNQDGSYRGLFISASNTVYAIGVEGANGCPCEENHPGYNVIKKFDATNTLVGETRIKYAGFMAITKDNTGDLLVTGAFGKRFQVLGPDTLYADSIQSQYGNYYDYSGKFLSRLNDINCTPPDISASTPFNIYGRNYLLCPGGTTTLSVNNTPGNFQWSNGATGNQTTVESTNEYFVTNTEPNGCIAYSLPVSVLVNENKNSHKICVVTLDSATNKNKIIVRVADYDYVYDVTQIKLYKNNGGNIIPVTSLVSVGYFYYGFIVDSTSDPQSGFQEYYISSIDTCGTESALSPVHRSLHVSALKNGNNKNELNWNKYIGSEIRSYWIMRGNSADNLAFIDSVDANTTTYVDQNTSAGQSFYQLQAVKSDYSCYEGNGKWYYAAKSNIVNADSVILFAGSATMSNNSLDIFPNPAQHQFMLSYHSARTYPLKISIRNILGQVIYSESLKEFKGDYQEQIDLSENGKGIYFVEVFSENQKSVKKIILN